MKLHHFFLLMIICSSCAPAYVNNKSKNIELKTFDSVKFIYDLEQFSNKIKVSDFVTSTFMREDWETTRQNLLNLARENSANAIYVEKLRDFGNVLRGELYQVPASELQNINPREEPFNSRLIIFRDNLGGLISNLSNLDLKINDNFIELENKSFKIVEVPLDAVSFDVSINGETQKIPLEEGTNIYWVTKYSAAPSGSVPTVVPGTINIAITDFSIIKVESKEKVRVWFSTFEK